MTVLSLSPIVVKACGSECHRDVDCEAYCEYDIWYSNGDCSDGYCLFQTENCNDYDCTTGMVCYGEGTSTLIEEGDDYSCSLEGCYVEGPRECQERFECNAGSELTNQSCAGSDYYCYYNGGYKWETSYPENETNCSDGHDNDNDGLIDNEDTDCYKEPSCDVVVCNGYDGWYNTTNTQWASTGECTEKEQLEQEYRDYYCFDNKTVECQYNVTDNQWIDTGDVGNVPDQTECNDGLNYTIYDVCTAGVCGGQIDNDGDGYGNDDCNDSDSSINPGAVEVCDDSIDNNCNGLVDCEDPSCSEFSACLPPAPAPTGGGFSGPSIVVVAVCGNDKCEYKEDCGNCPEDCLMERQVCCDNVSYDGNCCVDTDCPTGQECDPIDNTCYTVTGGTVTSGCLEDWLCTDWSDCVEGNRTRTCVDTNDCGTELNKTAEVEACEETPITGLFGFFTTAPGLGIIAAAFVLFLILFFWRRKK